MFCLFENKKDVNLYLFVLYYTGNSSQSRETSRNNIVVEEKGRRWLLCLLLISFLFAYMLIGLLSEYSAVALHVVRENMGAKKVLKE